MTSAELVLLAQAGPNDAALAGVLGSLCCVGVFMMVFVGVMVVSGWIIFEKAGEPGWASLIPIYNTVVMCRIAGKPEWWVLLTFIPFVNIVVAVLIISSLCEKFGAGMGFAIGMILLPFVFFPMLAFGSYEFEGRSRRRRKKVRRRDFDDDEERRPRRRLDEDDEDRPRKRRRIADDDDEDRPRPRRRPRPDDDY